MTRVCAAATCRCSQGLSQDTIKLAVRVLQDTVARQLTARQVCTVDLGVGQLLFCTGSTTRAEFTARLSWQQHTAAPAEPPAAPAGVPAAPSTGQPCSSSVGSNSTCSKASPAAAAKAPGSSTTAMPEKPSNCHYDRGCLGGGTRGQDSCCTERARQGCSACAAGRRSRRPRCRGAPHAARQGPGVSTGHLWAAAGGCRPISSFSQLIKESCVSHSLQVLAATMCATGPSPPTLPACWGGGVLPTGGRSRSSPAAAGTGGACSAGRGNPQHADRPRRSAEQAGAGAHASQEGAEAAAAGEASGCGAWLVSVGVSTVGSGCVKPCQLVVAPEWCKHLCCSNVGFCPYATACCQLLVMCCCPHLSLPAG